MRSRASSRILSRALDGRRVLRLPGGMRLGLANLAAALALALASLALGALSLSWGETRLDLLAALDADQTFALYQVRLPRLLLGFMAGWSVALAGAMLQSLARNPLADPGLLGLSQGAMVAVMALTVLAPGLPPAWLPVAALLGGLAVAALLLSLVRGHAGGLAVLLMGLALESTLSAVTAVLVLYTPPETSHALAGWMAGSLALADWPRVAMLAPWFAASLAAILLLGRALRLLDLGAPMAMALGLDAARARAAVLVAAVLLSSAALTAVGPLMFLGVMAPQLAGALSPASGRARLLLAALTGGLLVTAADLLARNAGTDIGLPVGLVLVTLGAPVFVLALRMRLLLRTSSS